MSIIDRKVTLIQHVYDQMNPRHEMEFKKVIHLDFAPNGLDAVDFEDIDIDSEHFMSEVDIDAVVYRIKSDDFIMYLEPWAVEPDDSLVEYFLDHG